MFYADMVGSRTNGRSATSKRPSRSGGRSARKSVLVAVLINSNEAAGQAVMHAHIHLIPSRKGDTPMPRGGVRGVIPARLDY